ncbi:MAG: amidohydrolase family protein [Cytophagales bacterium]|nr:MAG: amidohydrolase [Rhodothermaeota bacterium MED-G19]
MQFIRFFLLLFFVSYTSLSQEGFPINGVEDNRDNHYAFINAKIHLDYKTSIDNGTLIIKNGLIENVGSNVQIPNGIRVFDLEGKHIYPSFIDLYSDYAIVKGERRRPSSNWMSSYTNPQMLSNKNGPFSWNESIKPEINGVENLKFDEKRSKELRGIGFGAVLSHNMDGIIRGTGALVSLNDNVEQNIIIKDKASTHYSFAKGSTQQNYPNSLMGAVALLKQSFLDADWYLHNKGKMNEVHLSFEAINHSQSLPKIIEVRDKIRVLLAQKVANEMNFDFIIKGAGDEYQRLNEIKENNSKLIVPINFPKASNVDDPFKNNNLSLSQLKHWELAPSNFYFLEREGIDFSITTNGLNNLNDFRKNLIKSLNRGVSKETLLKSLTYNPSKFLNVDDKIGSIKKSYHANFFVTDGDFFNEQTKVLSNWTRGNWNRVASYNNTNYSGTYDLEIEGVNKFFLEITGDKNSPKATINLDDEDSTKIKTKLNIEGLNINLSFIVPNKKEFSGEYKLSGYWSEDKFKGKGTSNNLEWLEWNANLIESNSEKNDRKVSKRKQEVIGDVIFPFVEYGTNSKRVQENIIIRNATVWTLESDGKIEKGDVLIENGKISAVGENLQVDENKYRVIDGEGMHLTPGIVDEHSHIALTGVNEGSQSVTSEVRMKDVVNSEDVNIYRQLAGGVTTAQLLHGSANPIGGQSAIIKLRWGSTPKEMLVKGADEYIKFALGENVKRSRAPSNTRFPDSRMGVEQVFVDAFNRAKIYSNEWSNYDRLSKKEKINSFKPRRDLELDALVEILNGERFITCHSYVQSEINMLIKVAEQFNFNVATFTHILEGYKVADKMSDHGVGASTFSDWWAYKNEVKEAIPYNAALMTMAGVVTAINSDSREMARRLNQEAGKSVKYGAMDEIEALKLVTLNPAKLIHLDNRIGSIKVGKDADLVLWTDHPLSIYTKPSKTIVDGKVYFDIDQDIKLRKSIKEERARIISKMKGSDNPGSNRRFPMRRVDVELHCDDVFDYEVLSKILN